jgi:hypothetical protein
MSLAGDHRPGVSGSEGGPVAAGCASQASWGVLDKSLNGFQLPYRHSALSRKRVSWSAYAFPGGRPRSSHTR